MSGPTGFALLDEQARSGASGYTLAHCARRVAGAVARHLGRVSEASGRNVTTVDGAGFSEPWRELGRLLRVESCDDPLAFARLLFRRIGRGAVVVCASEATQWGGAVADELAALASRQRFDGWIVELSTARHCPDARPIGVAELVEPGDLERWWQALWHAERSDGSLAPVDRLDEGERWWWAMRGAGRAPSAPLSAEARALLARLGCCRRLVPRALQVELGTRDALGELVERDLVAIHDDGSACAREPDAVPARDDLLAVATALGRSGDPWDGIRAAELLLDAGELERAAACAEEVLGQSLDPLARMDLWSRWELGLARLRGPLTSRVAQRFSELALRLGDVEPAFALARLAATHGGDRSGQDLLLCLGRAAAARGELGTASMALEGARTAAASNTLRAQATVELAEIALASGDASRATELATEAVALATDVAGRLAARNVIGKRLLAEGAWRDAERHFALDAHDASSSGELEASLRAELNQATALVMGGQLDAAQSKFQQVLDAATSHRQPRPSAFALSNLAVLAARRHDLGQALALRERSVRLFRRIGNRAWLGRAMIYLADLRADLGLVDEAEQGLGFARRMLGPRLRPTDATYIGYVASRVHLARQDMARAAGAIGEALRSAPGSNDGTMLAECHCQAARVALADGDSAGAAHHIALARGASKAPASRVELGLLDAMLARLEGKDAEPLALAALEAAARVGDGRRSAEAHRLIAFAASRAGDFARARAERERAAALEETLVAGLPAELGARCRAHLARHAPSSEDGATVAGPTVRPRDARQQMVGGHPAVERLRRAVAKVAPTEASVLVVGESGTGKELVADALHRQSRRRAGPLVKVNCAALVETLLLSELFGHERGAFTGASHQHRGCFEVAAGGTIFLDEIGELSPATQAALLRVLQERSFLRVGGTELVTADARVVCATHRDLAAMMRAGSFREDLYYRLSAVVLEVPPLRERADDIPLLSAVLLERIAREQHGSPKRLSTSALALLARQPWPGNVRELENVLRVAALFTDDEVVTAEHLLRHTTGLEATPTSSAPRPTASSRVAELPSPPSAPAVAPASVEQLVAQRDAAPPSADRAGSVDAPNVEEVAYDLVRSGAGLREVQKRLELHCIVRALRETGGHVGRAAALLGIKRPRLSQLIKQYNLRYDAEEP